MRADLLYFNFLAFNKLQGDSIGKSFETRSTDIQTVGCKAKKPTTTDKFDTEIIR